MEDWEYDTHWIEPAAINYREITDWPHLNKCVSTLEVCGRHKLKLDRDKGG